MKPSYTATVLALAPSITDHRFRLIFIYRMGHCKEAGRPEAGLVH
jgi:hypothetical protein